jgi:hypothetical protein
VSEACAAKVYRPRDPQSTPLYRLVETFYEEVKGSWEERFERLYGRWRGFLDRVVSSYVDCGNYSCGFARVRCPECASEYLVAFSCQTRSFCPSCAAKRAAIFGAYLVEEVVAEVGHVQWVFTVPKLLRPYFLHHRELLGKLSQAAWQTIAEMVDAAAGGNEPVRPGMVSVIQTARSDLGFSPHIHALAGRGGWTADGRWVPVPFVDSEAAEKIFRQKVMRFLKDEGLLSEERAAMLLSWRRSGFSVHNSVTASAADQGGFERLARYLMRPPLSLERLHLDHSGQAATYRVKRSARAQHAGSEVLETFDPRELLARILIHVAEPRAHLVRHYGEYSVAARAKRRRKEQPIEHGHGLANPTADLDQDPSPAERRASRRAWAKLIRRIFETDPLLCDCGAQMKIIAVITEPGVVDSILRHLERHGATPARDPPS